LGACALAVSSQSANAQALKLGQITPPSHVWQQAAARFAIEMDKASGGKMKVTVSLLQKLGS